MMGNIAYYQHATLERCFDRSGADAAAVTAYLLIFHYGGDVDADADGDADADADADAGDDKDGDGSFIRGRRVPGAGAATAAMVMTDIIFKKSSLYVKMLFVWSRCSLQQPTEE